MNHFLVESSKVVYTVSDFWNFPNDGKIHEIINGEHYMSKAPSVIHQRIAKNIKLLINGQLEDGEWLDSPIGLILDNENGYMPDIAVISNENSDIIKERGIFGAPDWIIEILSPGNRRKDLIEKRDVYKKHGVKEYWCVDTEIDQIHVFLLKDEYEEKIVRLEKDNQISASVFNISMRLDEVFKI